MTFPPYHLLITIVLCSFAHSIQAAPKPNFVVILIDDLGASDVGSYGHPENRTPHLDELARTGVKFETAHPATALATGTSRLPMIPEVRAARAYFDRLLKKLPAPVLDHEGAPNENKKPAPNRPDQHKEKQ